MARIRAARAAFPSAVLGLSLIGGCGRTDGEAGGALAPRQEQDLGILRRGLASKVGSLDPAFYTGVADGAVIMDPYTVEITTEVPHPHSANQLAEAGLRIVPRRAVMALGERRTRPENHVSSAALSLKSWNPSEAIRLERNPRCPDADNVAPEDIRIHPTPDEQAAFNRGPEEGRASAISTVRGAKLAEAEQVLLDEAPYVPLAFSPDKTLRRPELEGLGPMINSSEMRHWRFAE